MTTTTTAAPSRNPFSTLDLEDDEDDDDVVALQQEKKKKKKRKAAQRRRRRSSARFLKLGAQHFDDDDEEDETPPPESEQLGALYKRAIRLNAENRINAGNSWNLRLIENMDKLVSEEPTTEQQDSSGTTVNFTKASCTLDASVKIYSYRVDDVHLTSYKVLANLNRNDATEKPTSSRSRNDNADDSNDNSNMDNDDDEENNTKERKAVDTLESNVANLNLNKLDAAYDIDPLFHKMSKTFDEGGARGLLLVNLGVGSDGCNIVFDSKEEQQEEEEEVVNDSEGMVDITGLTAKLDAASTMLELVPQLHTLRQEYAVLEQEGFLVHDKTATKTSRRYASSQQEEKEAEMSIHQDHLERSRMSQATSGPKSDESNPLDISMGDDEQEYAADDYGGGDDDDDDFGFDDFIQKNADSERYSSISFQNEPFLDTSDNNNTATLLDALCSTEMSQNDYEFFSQDAIEKLNDNVWAGSQHWKRGTQHLQRKATPVEKNKKEKKRATKKKKQALDLSLTTTDQLEDLLKPPPKKRGGADPLQLSKAMIAKYTKTDNVLPLDAGMGIDQLSKLFLRPTAIVKTTTTTKTVGFHDTVQFESGAFDDGSFGDDDNDGPGFEFNDDEEEDFAIQALDVRKVDKIRVGYATVAKKVDVKRLKKDLWNELETKLDEEEKADDDDMEKEDNDMEKEVETLSFKTTVEEMQQSQADVTLPFYFICLLHLANEKGLRLDSQGLYDIDIHQD